MLPVERKFGHRHGITAMDVGQECLPAIRRPTDGPANFLAA